MDYEVPNFSIKEVSDITGVNSVTLRAWQRRYGLLNPERTEKGHRLYSKADIEKIRQILLWLEKGVAISKVRPLIEGAQQSSDLENQEPENQKIVASLIAALADCHRGKLEQQLIQVMKEYPTDVFINQMVSMVEKEINQPANPIANIQQSLWQSVMTERCVALISQARKQNTQLGYLISFDKTADYSLWLKAWLLVNEGYAVTVMPALEGRLTALSAVIQKQAVKRVVVFGNSGITAANLSQLANLVSQLNCKCELAGDITEIHADFKNKYQL